MRFFIFVFCLALFSSCDDKPSQDVDQAVKQSDFSIKEKHADVVSVQKNAANKIDEWVEYRNLKEYLVQYKSISPNEALNNSRELNKLVEKMKDSVKPKFLEVPSFSARVNLMNNETLRLYDMSSISAIKFNEVNDQVTKILEAFSSINSKINTLVQQEELDRQVDDPKFNRLFLDSTTTKTPKKEQKAIQNKNIKKKETQRERMMRLSKEDRLRKREMKLKEMKLEKLKTKPKKKNLKLKKDAKIDN